jgi:hypothetical protein
MAFAWLEMRTVVRQLALRTKLRFAPGYQPSAVQRSVTLSPAKGLPVIREA